MNNELEDDLSAWPTRLYVFEEKKLQFIAQPKNSTFEISDLFEFLEEYEK
jgi:hypothetical protein